MKRSRPAAVASKQPVKLSIGKRKRDSETEPTPTKRLSHTKSTSTTPSTTTTQPSAHTKLPPPPLTAGLSALKGFLPLPVQLYPDNDVSTVGGSSAAARYVYYRAHHAPMSASDEEAADVPADRTLLVVNVPYCWRSEEVSELFSCFGEVEQAVILNRSTTTTTTTTTQPHNRPPLLLAPLDQSVYETAAVSAGLDVWQPAAPHPYYCSARVIFTSATSLTTATSPSLSTSIATSLQPYIPPPPNQPAGLSLLLAHYSRQRPSVTTLRDSVNRFMAAFDTQQQQQQRALTQHNSTDDGWTVVRSKRSSRLTSGSMGGGGGSEEERMERLEVLKRREDKKRAAVSGLTFYRFQGVERRQSQLVELRRRFEEDKTKVAAMKANRKFKPM